MFAIAPFVNGITVTKSDTTSVNCSAVYVGGAGNLDIKFVSTGATISFIAPPVGTVLNIHLKDGRIMNSTTATNLIALS